MKKNIRKSGLLLHITSLPDNYGWGKFSKECYEFIDFLKKGGFSIWQVLPFTHSSLGASPYSAYSSFAINPIFLDLSEFLTIEELNSFNLNCCNDLEEYAKVFDDALTLVCEKCKNKYDLSDFIKKNNYWLQDYALFILLKKKYACPWYDFPKEFKNREKIAMDNFIKENKKGIDNIILIQYLLDLEWNKIKKYANENGIEIFGDIPFYTCFDSSDVWANKQCWLLEDGKPKLVSGVPPDYFNSEGQLWGDPIYDYDYLKKHNYNFFVNRFKKLSQLFDIVRIDHFVAFSRYWAILPNSKTAKKGKWIKGAGKELLKALTSKCSCKIVAEDLGIVTDDVIKLKEEFNLPGVKVLQFAFDDDCDNAYKPHNYEKNCVAYIGTHDNNTFMGLLNEGNWDKINRFKRYFNMPLEYGNDVVVDNAILALYKSSADTVIFTVQDILKLGSDCRMNVPGVAKGNWKWQLKFGLDTNLCEKFKYYANLYGRN